MATRKRITSTRRPIERPRGVRYVSRSEGAKLVDRQAKKYLGMSGAEFVRRYEAGEIDDPDRAEVRRVAMLIPFAK